MSQSFKWQSRESHQRQSNAQKCIYGCLGTKMPHLLQTKTGISLLVGGKMQACLDFFHLKIEGEISRNQTYSLSHVECWALGISCGFSRQGGVQLQQKVSFKISPSMAQSQEVPLPAGMPSGWSWGAVATWRSNGQCRTLVCNVMSQGHPQSCWTGRQKRERRFHLDRGLLLL